MRKITSLLIMAVLCLTLSGCYATGLLELANLSGLTPQSYTLSPSQTTFYFDEYPYYDEDYDPADYDEYVSVSYDEYPDEYLDEYLYDEGLSGYYAAEIVNTLQFPVKIEAINIDFMGTDGSVLSHTSDIGAFPSILQPGETAYAGGMFYIEATSDKNDVQSMELSIVTYQTTGTPSPLTFENVRARDVQSGIIITGKAANNTSSDMYLPSGIVAALNSEGKLLTAQPIYFDILTKGVSQGFETYFYDPPFTTEDIATLLPLGGDLASAY